MALFREIVGKGRAWLPLIAVCSIIGTGVTLALPAVLGAAIDTIVLGGNTIRLLILAAGLIALAVLTDIVNAFASTACVAGTTAWLRTRLLGHLLAVGPQRTREFPTGDLVNRVSGNSVDAAQAGTSVVVTVIAVLPPLGSLVLLALIDIWVALAFLLGVGLVALVLWAFTRHTTAVAADYQRVQGNIAGRLAEALQGIRTIAAARTVKQEEKRILQDMPSLSEHGNQMWKALARSSAQAAVVGPVVLVAVLAVGGLQLANGQLTAGELFAASRYAVLGAGLGALTGVLGSLSRARAGMGRVAEVLAQPIAAYGSQGLSSTSDGELEFRNVSVDGLLHDIDLTLPGGACIAIVGRSGSGKSVLAEVAARLRDPDEGAVLLDGIPLTELTHDELRRAIGCAFERPHLVGATVGDAIGLGRDPISVGRASQAVQAHSFVIRLPMGYQTPLAETPMSGGERQRLGLARAWHAERVLVLDDATSSLDMVTEMKIGQAFLADSGKRTRLVITHRVPTAAKADLVVWLDDGHVRAVGPHARLWCDPDYRAVLQ
ncbi:MAG TPA: ABC transporter ATP-binding protein [Micromonosporaceae bacterium]|nr:ABC transporter ATP-binding protein [Micromonosporaceae bacterium]HCU49534.1 ABC transporter ATP-binding protein [Micromonosporaceae bacterium]